MLKKQLKMFYSQIYPSTQSASNNAPLSLPAIVEKINESLVTLAYRQTNFGILTSIFCGIIIWVRTHSDAVHISASNFWFFLLLSTSLLRFILVKIYLNFGEHTKNAFWRKLYIAQATLGGGVWGLLPILLLPGSTSSEQILMVMVIAGITSGAVPFISSVLTASVIYSSTTLIPLLVYFIFLNASADLLMALATAVYLIFLIVQSKKINAMLANGLLLQFELHAAKNSLEYSATHDPLTKVANRNLFNKKFMHALATAKYHSRGLALIYLDLDHFKKVNDTYGHVYGDQLLMAFVQRLQEIFKHEDMIARLGGDEFTIILENIHDKSEVDQYVARLQEKENEPVVIKDHKFIIKASIGISIFPADGSDFDALLNAADTAMYAAKKKVNVLDS
ncbi:MAG: GGDEF domain-containing protein [Gammaproteobacteria bacterium]|nr:GGDEF domain-containing protein [Gammaproteobacteria bacterium]